MSKILLTALAAASALAIATPAAAQSVTGVVNITGNVDAKCIVVDDGNPSGADFGGTIALGELAQANGTLATDLATRFNALANNGQLQYKIVCNSANTSVAVDADPIVAATGTAQSGYANTVHYKASVAVTLVGGPGTTVENDSAAAPTTAVNQGGRLAATGTNIVVTASNFRTPNMGDIMVADTSYAGKITIVVAPVA